ncbi:MAG: lipopolysaccharide heptosyltransferase I [Nitrospirales bacterium]|nr:lipopolysaccharide heptosyltransferase I [Nitrospirales bacterium]
MMQPDPRKILIIKPSSLGDIIHALPFLQAVKERFPRAEVHWVVAKGLEGLLQNHPLIDRLWIINKDQWKKLSRLSENLREGRALTRALRAEVFDMVVDLQGLLRSGLIAYATRAPMRIGFAEAREGAPLFYTHRVEGGKEIHAVDRYLRIASAIGCDVKAVSFPMPPGLESDQVRRIRDELGDYVVMVPGARWTTKIWPAERFGNLAALIKEPVVVVGGKADEARGREIEALSEGQARSLAGKTDLAELVAIIRGCRCMVSNDSGPMHIAAGFNIPVVAIFGPTSPVRTGPYGAMHRIVTPHIPCAPCYKRSCKDLKCMDEISVEKVFEAARDLCKAKEEEPQ